jgi:hypothetical protein
MDTLVDWYESIDRELYSTILYDCGSMSLAIKSLMIWDEIFYNQCIDGGLSKGFSKFLLAQHIKVMMMVNDKTELCPQYFILKEDDGATGKSFGNVKFRTVRARFGPQIKSTISYGIKSNSHRILA